MSKQRQMSLLSACAYNVGYAHAPISDSSCVHYNAQEMSSDTSSGAGCGDISRARELLAQAVQVLSNSDGTTARARPSPSGDAQHPARRSLYAGHGSGSRSIVAERNLLFNFGGKRKLGITSTSNKKKKVALTFWNHEFVCLSDTEQDRTPTAQERASLIASGVY